MRGMIMMEGKWPDYNFIKQAFDRGDWTQDQVKYSCLWGYITNDEYKTITGKAYRKPTVTV